MHGRLVELGGRGRRHRHLAKLRGRLEERHKREQPHARLAKVHGGREELSERRRMHRRLAELGRRGCLHYHLAKLHGHLTELGGKRRSHRRLAKPSGRGQPHSRLTEEWQERNLTEEGDHTTIWKNGKRGAGLQPKPARNPGAKTFTRRTKFSLKNGNNI